MSVQQLGPCDTVRLEWTASGQHTGRTDLPLTLEGERHARQIAADLNGHQFGLVLTSQLRRAREACRLAGCGECAIVDTNLSERDYGDYESRTTTKIQKCDVVGLCGV
jgi:probable phosphoglycerate mutase